MSSAKTYQCPNCGGVMSYDADSGRLKCGFCETAVCPDGTDQRLPNSNNSQEDAPRIQIPIDPDATPVATSHAVTADEFLERAPWEIGIGGKADESLIGYTCPSCGAQVIADQSTTSTWCPYCDNNLLVSGIATKDTVPEKIFPFKVCRENALETVKATIAKKEYAPHNLDLKVEHMVGVYVPYWAFDISVDGEIVGSANDPKSSPLDKEMRAVHALFKRVPVDGSSKMPDAYMDALGSVGGCPQLDSFNSQMGKFLMKLFDFGTCEWEESGRGTGEIGRLHRRLEIQEENATQSEKTDANSIENEYWQMACDFDTSYVAGYLLEVPDESADDCFDRAILDVEATFKRDVETACEKMGFKKYGYMDDCLSYTLEDATLYAIPVWLMHCDCNGEDVLVAASGLDAEWCVADLPVSAKRRASKLVRAIPGKFCISALLSIPVMMLIGSIEMFVPFITGVYITLFYKNLTIQTFGEQFVVCLPGLLPSILIICCLLCILFIRNTDKNCMDAMRTTRKVHQADWCYSADGLVVSRS